MSALTEPEFRFLDGFDPASFVRGNVFIEFWQDDPAWSYAILAWTPPEGESVGVADVPVDGLVEAILGLFPSTLAMRMQVYRSDGPRYRSMDAVGVWSKHSGLDKAD